jgi:hypothetical protein
MMGDRSVPSSVRIFVGLRQKREIKRETLVILEGASEWRTAETVGGLFPESPQQPPLPVPVPVVGPEANNLGFPVVSDAVLSPHLTKPRSTMVAAICGGLAMSTVVGVIVWLLVRPSTDREPTSLPDFRVVRGAIRPVLGFPGCFVDRGVCWLCDLNW